MNIFSRELKSRRKSVFWWAISVIIFSLMSFVKFDTLASDTEATQKLMNDFPETIQAVFGMNGIDMTTLAGYFGTMFLYYALLMAVYAGLIGASLLSDEEQQGTSEFLYTKPASRRSILVSKLAAGLLMIAVIWSVLVVVNYYITEHMVSGDMANTFWPFMLGILLIQLVVFSVGLAISGVASRPKLPGRLIGGLLFAQYILYVFHQLSPDTPILEYLSIFSWFDAKSIIDTASLRVWAVAASCMFAVMTIATSFFALSRRDV